MKRELSLHESYQLLKTALVLLLHQWIRDELWVTGGGYLAAPLGLTSMTHPPADECWNAAM